MPKNRATKVPRGGNKNNRLPTSRQDDLKRLLNPKTGEDPGLLPSTEDPRERRLKRNTM